MKEDIQISSVHIETPLLLSEDFVQVLIIENPKEFYEAVTELEKAFLGEESNFVFSSEGKTVLPHKSGELLIDAFHFDLNDK